MGGGEAMGCFAPLSGRSTTFGEFLRAGSHSMTGDVCYAWNADRRVASPSFDRS
jgi:hypothetical protein